MSGKFLTYAAAVTAAGLAGLCATRPGLQAPALVALLAAALLGFSRLNLAGLAAAFIVSDHLVHIVKRLIFLFGPQRVYTYYAVQLLPVGLLILMFAAAARHLRGRRLPSSAKVLGAYLATGLLMTVSSSAGVPWSARGAALAQQWLPGLAFYAGLALGLEQFARLGRLVAAAVVVSAVYGVLQFWTGPTALDLAWAYATSDFSMQGKTVFEYAVGNGTEFRPFSYYADALTWGLFIVAAFGWAAVSKEFGKMGRWTWRIIVAAALTGLFVALTRTPWVGFLAMLATVLVLRWRELNRTWVVFGTAVAGFGAAVFSSTYVYDTFFKQLPLFDNPILARYATIGTLEVRVSAWDLLQQVIQSNWLSGTGYGYSAQYVPLAGIGTAAVLNSHNFLVEVVLNTGLAGLYLLLVFYYCWLRSVFSAAAAASRPATRRSLRWIVATSAGLLITGYFNGPCFLNAYFFLLLGVAASETVPGLTAALATARHPVLQHCGVEV